MERESGEFCAYDPNVMPDKVDEDPLPDLVSSTGNLDPLMVDLASALPDLIHMWSPSRDNADYVCAFCGSRPDRGLTEHADGCLGVRLCNRFLGGVPI